MSHDHTNDHNLDLTPFYTSLNNNALATIFQLSRADFFQYKCKSPHENEENGTKLQFDSLLINVPLTNDYPASRVDHFDLFLKSWERRSDTADIFKAL